MGSLSTTLSAVRRIEDASSMLDVLLERVKWQVQRYMRRHPERLFVDRRGYGNDAIGREQIRRMLGQVPDSRADEWLTELGVPTESLIQGMLERLDEALTEQTQALAES